jgi:hypothetical protein
VEGKRVAPNRRLVVSAIAVWLAVGCGGDPSPSVPAQAFPDLRAGKTAPLDLLTLAQDAVEPMTLRALLDRAGFAAATERTFVGGEGIRSVTARIVVFSSEVGAREYLQWLDIHPGDILGAAEHGPTIALSDGGSAFSYTASPGGCCAKATTTSLAAWQRGRRVLTVLAAGADAATGLEELARELDGAARSGTEES